MKYEAYYKKYLVAIERELERVLPEEGQHPPQIHEAMRYSVFPGGKRFRPVLTLAACEATGGKWEDALRPAVSLELIHCYSLVHDDLPALDNDEIRRGKLTCHKRFGEATAILTGDALLTLAFRLLAEIRPAKRAVKLLGEISTAAGTYGMIAGQVADLASRGNELTLPELDYIHIHKTGKLIKASAVCGVMVAGASKEAIARMSKFGECLGLVFQSIDDLVDGDGYVGVIQVDDIQEKVRHLIAQAKRETRPFGRRADPLHKLADFLLKRLPRSPSHAKVD